MKKYFIISLVSCILIFIGGHVKAATFKITASTAQVNPNGSFSVSVGGDCIGRVNLSISNGTLSENSVWVEQNYKTVNVKAGSSGEVTITATPTAGFSDSDANEYKPGARSTKVKIISNTNNSTSQEKPNTQKPTSQPNNNNPVKKTQTVIEEKSSNNLLSSLSTNIGNLVPNFDANITEYTVELPKDTKKLSINAQSQDTKSTVSGIGEFDVIPGENTIIVKVTAENGNEKTYTIKAHVDETPQVYLKYKNEEIGVVRNLKDITIPEGFKEKQHVINEYTINIFDNEHFIIIYGINSENIKNFYIVDIQKNECVTKIIPTTIGKHFFYLVDLQEEKEGFEISTIMIEDKEIVGYKFKNGFTDYFLLSVMNNEGKMIDYLYEMKEGTLQLYLESAPINYNHYKELVKEINNKQIIIYILITVIVITTIGGVVLFLKLRKGKLDEKNH